MDTSKLAVPDAARRKSNTTLFVKLNVIAVVMFGFGYALVPLYDRICEATGLRNIGEADEVRNSQVDTSRAVRIELDANLRKLPWTFRPLEAVVDVHPGELRQVIYEIANPTDRAITGQAIPSYSPALAAQYFRKIECFCFAQQTLQPGERRQMPVVFALDTALPNDVATITLSYTFFEVEGGGRT